MGINLGDVFPNFEADTTVGKIKFHDWIGDSWCILFSHPNDFTPVCTTELGRVLELIPEFQKRNVKVIAMSCNDVESHKEWIKNLEYVSRGSLSAEELKYYRCDIQCYAKCAGDSFPYPIISDPKRELAVQLGMLDPEEKDSAGMPLTCRAVFLIDSNKKLRLSILYPATTGRNFNELLRALDSLLLTDKKKVATPADWKYYIATTLPLDGKVVSLSHFLKTSHGVGFAVPGVIGSLVGTYGVWTPGTALFCITLQQGDECMILPSIPQAEVPGLFPKGHRIVQVPSKKEYIRITPQP